MQHRRYIGHSEQPAKRLSPEKAEKQKAMASCYMVVKFQDGKTWSKWSNEHAQAKIQNISDAINEMFRIIDKSFKGSLNVHSAAIFDTRVHKKTGAFNKIYQYEKGSWQMVQPVTW